MPNFAVIENGVIVNVIVADTLEIAETVTNLSCIEFTDDSPLFHGDELDEKKIKQLEKVKAKREADAAAAAAKAEAERVAAIEAELERVRALEAERLAAEEAAKPKPVTGIFVKVSEN
jgi:hypothetical protein